jgi:hypothetical protein
MGPAADDGLKQEGAIRVRQARPHVSDQHGKAQHPDQETRGTGNLPPIESK